MDDPYRVDAAPGEDTTGVWVPGAPVAAAWRALGLLGAALALALPATMLLDALADLGVLSEGALLVPAVAALGLFVAAGVAARRCLPPATGPWTRGRAGWPGWSSPPPSSPSPGSACSSCWWPARRC